MWRGEENLWGEISHEISHFSANAVQQNLRFQGQYLDRETGLHYNLFRYYDPVARRFTQPDPIGLMGGINTYQYAPNALGWIDPLGLSCSSDAKALRENMEMAGRDAPTFRNSAHHIVMSNATDVRMRWLRRKMDRLGIDINIANNGVYLPTSTKVKINAGADAIAHSRIHTNAYKKNVFDRLKNIDNAAGFRSELNKISDEISSGMFGY